MGMRSYSGTMAKASRVSEICAGEELSVGHDIENRQDRASRRVFSGLIDFVRRPSMSREFVIPSAQEVREVVHQLARDAKAVLEEASARGRSGRGVSCAWTGDAWRQALRSGGGGAVSRPSSSRVR